MIIRSACPRAPQPPDDGRGARERLDVARAEWQRQHYVNVEPPRVEVAVPDLPHVVDELAALAVVERKHELDEDLSQKNKVGKYIERSI